MDNHEPYHDEEEVEEQVVADFPSSFSNGHDDERPTRMQPMSVSTGTTFDYDAENDKRRATRKALCASIVAVVFLIIGLVWTNEEERADRPGTVLPDGSDRGHQTGFGGSGSVDGHDRDGPCRDYDVSYFNDLLWRVEAMNETDPLLCNQAVSIHDCKCRHPLRPTRQDLHPGWKVVLKMNLDLLQQNYSAVQPDVVLYGDSIVEHLIGRNYGHDDVHYHPTRAITQQLMTKRGGGHINGLPMGIAADQIANLLYRLQRGGEMPDTLHPKVWWVLIGTMDLGMGCAIDSVVAGILNIAKEIHHIQNNQHKTLTPVVINSLLPRGRQELFSEHSSWASLIAPVNQQLACYADITPGVHYVNSTDIFVTTNASGSFLNETLMNTDHLHPSNEGNRLWEEQIVSNVMQFMT